MATWHQFQHEAGEFAKAVHARFTAHKHHVLATLRRDGSPRVSGTEVDFFGPDMVIGSMWRAVKALDLRRDNRFAIHANPGDESTMTTQGDAKIAGRAIEVTDPDELAAYRDGAQPPGDFHLFRLDLTEVVLTSVRGDRLVVETWRPGQPITRTERT